MRNSSQNFAKMRVRLQNLAFLAVIALISILSAGTVLAQDRPAETPAQSPAPQAPVTAPGQEYKASLEALSKLYQAQLERVEKQNKQSQDLYKDGLIARRDLEDSDKALVDARAKVEDVAKQIVAANQPPVVTAAPELADANQITDRVWSTGNSRIDSLIRYHANLNGVDPYLVFCLMSQESKFTSSATSYKGAQG